MKRFFFLILAVLFISCDEGKRPNSEEDFIFKISGTSILKSGTVSLLNDTEKEIATAMTDDTGKFEIPDVESATGLLVKVCGGKFYSVAIKADVDFSGCLVSKIAIAEGDITIIVDFLSTFVSSYDSETALEEWSTYLDITTNPFPELQSSLTDATKRYLWEQGLSKIAENVSNANSVTPESMYSTENLFKLLISDLVDDAIINGSTSAKFGALTVDSSVLKNILADAIPDVSETFKKADLKTWTDKIRNSEAKFLGGEGSGTDTVKPVITITAPEGVNPVISGTVTVTATATDDKTVASLLCVINGEDMPELTDTDETPENFASTFDSSLIADGKITIKCTASDGTNLGELEKSAVISNSNTVKMKAYITNELTLWDSVSVYNSKNEKVASAVFEAEEKTEILLAPGIYRFVFKGGTYKPVFLADETIEFDGTLESSGEVKAGEVTNIIATPLTTIREYLYTALEDKGDTKAEEKSLTLISEHIDSDFPLYIEPVSKNQLTENSKYYIVLAALERLAVLVGERHDPALEAGAITIEQVIKALTDDLEADSKAVLDGGASINQFPVDSYLFRYWYAIALKLFLESEKNTTGLKFSDLQTVISNISMDESELFPEAEEAKKVTDQPPVISEKQFKRSYETEYQNYSVENIIYANDSVFKIKFKALPDETGDLIIDLVELFGDVEVQSLSDINEEGVYTAEVKFPVAEDGEKSIGIRAIDNAENTGNATLQAVKDTVKPLIDNLGNTLPTNVTTPLTVPYAVTETNPLDSMYSVTPAGEAATVWTSLNPAILAGDITVTDSLLDEDGAYTLHFKSVDRAGNEKVQTKTLSFDRIIPTATFTTLPEINENGFIAQNSIAITIIATDNLTSETELLHEMFDGVSWVENIEAVKNVWNMQLLSEQLYAKKFRVKDLAGNKSADVNVSFTVDTVFPVLTTNKAALESTAYNIASTNLKLISTCTESNLLAYSYSINGGDLVSITEQSTPLTDNASLVEGLNTIVVKCTDKAENYTEETISLLIDNTPPRVDSVLSSPGASVCALSQAVQLKTVDDVSKPVSVKYYYSFGSYLVSDIYSMPVLETGETTVSVPNGADTYYSTLSFTKETQPGSIFVSVVDQAGNESEPYPVNWNLDREPPKFSIINLEDFGFGVINPRAENIDFDEYLAKYNEGETVFNAYVAGLIAESGLSDITSLKGYINSVLLHNYTNLNIAPENLTAGKCSPTICSNSDIMKPCLWCAMTKQTSTFTLKATFTDSCGNSGSTTDCTDSDYTCITRSLNPQTPELSVNVNQISTETHSLEILSQGATILTCKIYRNSDNTFIRNCSTVTGTQQIDTTALTAGIYRVIVTSKYPDGTTTATASDTFLVDRTAFSISVNVDTTKAYYVDFPALKYDVKIASGLKQLKLYMTGHSKNKYYVTAGESANYNCESENKCSSTIIKRLVNTTTTAKGNMLPAKTGGYYNIDGGWYSQIYYEATPNFGDVKTGTITIGYNNWGSGLGFVKNPSQDTRMTMTEAGNVTIIQSIIDEKIYSPWVYIIKGTCSDKVCKKKEGSGYFYLESYFPKCTGSAFTNTSVDTYFTGKITKAGNSKYYWNGGACNANVDCPTTADYCDTYHKRCVADLSKHSYYETEGYEGSCNPYDELDHIGCNLYISSYYYPVSAYVDIVYLTFRPKKFFLKDYVATYHFDNVCSSMN